MFATVASNNISHKRMHVFINLLWHFWIKLKIDHIYIPKNKNCRSYKVICMGWLSIHLNSSWLI